MREVGAAVAAAWPWALAVVVAALGAATAGYVVGRHDMRTANSTAPLAPVDVGGANIRRLVQDVITAHDLAAGAKAVQAQLETTLETAGVRRISVADGVPFDANRHHAVGTEPAVKGRADRCVAREIRAGWQTGDQVVRPAEVIVWKR